MSARPSQTWTLLGKDLRLEWRAKARLVAVGVFVGVLVTVGVFVGVGGTGV